MTTLLMVFCRSKLDFVLVKSKRKCNQNADYEGPIDLFYVMKQVQGRCQGLLTIDKIKRMKF